MLGVFFECFDAVGGHAGMGSYEHVYAVAGFILGDDIWCYAEEAALRYLSSRLAEVIDEEE